MNYKSITGECQNCNSEFVFDPNNLAGETFYGTTHGNFKQCDDAVYAVCPFCGHHNSTGIVKL